MKVFINGGLGNQLFQLAYAHQYLVKDVSAFEIVADPNPRIDRPFDLSPLLQKCRHAINAKQKSLIHTRIIYLGQRILKKLSQDLLASQRIVNSKSFTESTPFVFTPPVAYDSRVYFGYFQHWKYVESVWETFGAELESIINEILLPFEIDSFNLSKTCIVHIRRGDLVRSVETMGILDLDFYKEAILRIRKNTSNDLKFIGITDDFAGAKKISEELGLDLLLGPSELSSWQSIALMAKSKAVVCANSTFSWWGGILSAKKGGAVVIPNPWFVNWHEEVGDAFLHPNLIPVDSSFLKMKDFETDFKD